MSAYYNEHDPFAAAWLRELIKCGHIAAGVVDERSIEDVHPYDLAGFTQCHFFAGIGVWSYALRLAGWPDDRPVWTGSCPCQPFSSAGKGFGFDDERHLWPAWHWLIKECKPAVIIGEQVASKDAEPWIDLVHADMEAMGYAFGCVPFPSAGIGAPHIRDRAYWMAHSHHARLESRRRTARSSFECTAGQSGMAFGLANPANQRLDRRRPGKESDGGDAPRVESQRFCAAGLSSSISGFWRAADWLSCRDGKWRPVEPGSFPLVDGSPARVGRLRGYGNAINAQAAAEFIRAASPDIHPQSR